MFIHAFGAFTDARKYNEAYAGIYLTTYNDYTGFVVNTADHDITIDWWDGVVAEAKTAYWVMYSEATDWEYVLHKFPDNQDLITWYQETFNVTFTKPIYLESIDADENIVKKFISINKPYEIKPNIGWQAPASGLPEIIAANKVLATVDTKQPEPEKQIVPNTGHIDIISFNTDLSVEEFYAICEQLDFIDTSTYSLPYGEIYAIAATSDMSTGVAIFKGENETYNISILYPNGEYSRIFGEMDDDYKWCNNRAILNIEAVDSVMGILPVGQQNDLLANVCYITEEPEKETIPDNGHIDKVSFRTLSIVDTNEILSTLTFKTLGPFGDWYVIASNADGTNALAVNKTNTSIAHYGIVFVNFATAQPNKLIYDDNGWHGYFKETLDIDAVDSLSLMGLTAPVGQENDKLRDILFIKELHAEWVDFPNITSETLAKLKIITDNLNEQQLNTLVTFIKDLAKEEAEE